MRTSRILGVVTLVAAMALAEPARAQYQTTTAIVAGSVFGAADLFFIVYDLTMSERNQPPARVVVWIELSVMTLQIATGISMVATALQSDSRLRDLGIDRDLYLPLGAALATVAAPLFAHAVRHSVDRGSGMHALRIAPARVGDLRAGGPGLVVAGVF